MHADSPASYDLENEVEVTAVTSRTFNLSLRSNYREWTGYYLVCVDSGEYFCDIGTITRETPFVSADRIGAKQFRVESRLAENGTREIPGVYFTGFQNMSLSFSTLIDAGLGNESSRARYIEVLNQNRLE